MIDKPVHRRSVILSSRHGDSSVAGAPWLLPVLLLIEAVFIGSTFNTLAFTLPALVCGGLVVLVTLQWLGPKHGDPQGKPADVRRSVLKDVATPEGEQQKRRLARLSRFRSISFLPLSVLIAGSGAAIRVTYHLSTNLNPVALLVDLVAHFSLLISLVLWVYHPRRGHPAMLVFGLLMVLMAVTAGGVSHSINGQLVAALGTVIGFAFAADYILGFWQPTRAMQRRERRNRSGVSADLPASTVSMEIERGQSGSGQTDSGQTDRGRSPLLYSILALSILLMSTTAVGHVAANVIPGLQMEFFDRLSRSLEAVTSNTIIGGTRYVRGSRLGSIRQHMLGDPAEVALRAYSPQSPGYLRGTAFDTYRNGSWSAINRRTYDGREDPSALNPRSLQSEGPGEASLVGDRQLALERFQVRKKSTGALLGTVEIHNVPLKGQIVFTSLSTDWIEASSFGVTVSHHDLIIKGVDTQTPYVLGINTDTPRETLAAVRREVLLWLPDRLSQSVTPIAEEVCEGHLTAQAKARAIEEFFQSNFSYSLRGTTPPSRIDPVTHFLTTRHPAHCEFFATAAAVMLRSVGVPTRYVTGYVLDEKSDDGEYWIARNRAAHAWVEAYDDISERWFPVEATVGRRYHTLLSADEIAQQEEADASGFLDFQDDETLVGRVLGWFLSLRTADSLTFLFRIAQAPLFCILIGLLWIRQRQKNRALADPAEVRCRQMLLRVDKKMKRYALVRAPNETLHQFATRVETVADQNRELSSVLSHAATWYRSFAAARYRGQMPEALVDEGSG